VGQHDQWAAISVRDRGVGIPHEELPHMFTPFYRAPTARGIPGTGIGLSGSKIVVEQHGGQIAVESASARAPLW
jgi:two-component system sensor histidine kinase MprB